MPLSLHQSKHLQAIAVLMMLCLHLFNRPYQGLFEPLIFIGRQPLTYYISLFGDACVPLFAFVSGYGLYYKYQANKQSYCQGHKRRLKNLYLKYWVVLLLFAVLLGGILHSEDHPGSWSVFFQNLSGLNPTYNGAWWYFTTYVFFVLTSSFWFKLTDRLNPFLFLGALFLIYLVAFYFRIYKTNVFSNPLLIWMHQQTALYFCTLFQFMIGTFAFKYKWTEKIGTIARRLPFKNGWMLLGIILLIVAHGIVHNFIVAPFTGLGFILLFTQMELPKFVHKSLDFISPHSANLWLIHMFFYITYFPVFIYSFKYPLIIYVVLLALSLGSSYIVSFILRNIKKVLVTVTSNG